MEFEPNKDKAEAPSNVTLGVEVHLQVVRSEGKVSFAPTKKEVCGDLAAAARV